MWALYKLQAKVFFRNPSSIFSFVTVTIYAVILGSVVVYSTDPSTGLPFPDATKSQALIAVFASVAAISIMNVGLYSFGYSFFDMKNSVLLRRIGSTKITKTQILFVFTAWGMTVLIMANVYLLFLMYFFSNLIGYFPTFYWGQINWSGYFLAVLIGGVAAFTVGFFLISLSKNSEVYMVLSTLYFFIFSVFAGLFTPGSTEVWMDWIGRFSPIYWTANLISHAASGGDVFHLGGYTVSSFPLSENIGAVEANLELFMPFVFIGLFATASSQTFKWGD